MRVLLVELHLFPEVTWTVFQKHQRADTQALTQTMLKISPWLTKDQQLLNSTHHELSNALHLMFPSECYNHLEQHQLPLFLLSI